MPPTPFFHLASGTVRFWVRVDEALVGASISKETLHYRYTVHPASGGVDADPLRTYAQNAGEIDAAVRRRVAAGSREPVMIRSADIPAPARV